MSARTFPLSMPYVLDIEMISYLTCFLTVSSPDVSQLSVIVTQNEATSQLNASLRLTVNYLCGIVALGEELVTTD